MLVIRHIAATILSIVLFNVTMIGLGSNSLLTGGELCGYFSVAWATVFWWPIAYRVESDLIIKRGWRWWTYLPAITIIDYLISILLIAGFTLLTNAGEVDLLSLQELVLSITYWGAVYSITFFLLKRLHFK